MGGGDNSIEETPEQKAFADVSMKKWNKYKSMYRPVENRYMEDVERKNSGQAYNQAANLGAVPMESQFTRAVTNTAGQMASRGYNPNSGLFKQELQKLDEKKRKAKSDIMTQAQVSQQDRYTQGLQSIVAMGQGQQAQSMSGLGDLAGMANQRAFNDAQLDQQERFGNQQVAGAVVGGGLRYGLNQIDGNKR